MKLASTMPWREKVHEYEGRCSGLRKRDIKSLLLIALFLEVLQKSEKTYAIDRGFLCFFRNMNNRKLN